LVVIKPEFLVSYVEAVEFELIAVRIVYREARELHEVLKEVSSELDKHSSLYVVLPAEFAFSTRHVLSAFIHCLRSLRRGGKLRDPNMEFLRYYFGVKQIRDVKSILEGITSREFVCIAYGDGEKVLESIRRCIRVHGGEILEDIVPEQCDVKKLSKVFSVKLEVFDRGKGLIKALELGVLEKIALLDLRK